jgi:pto-interacting protein 1
LEELNEVTRNFSNDVLIGEGRYAKCFLGVLKDGQNVAVKKLDTSEEIQVEVMAVRLAFFTFAVIVLHLLLRTSQQ